MSSTKPPFPAATILGYPRIGPDRELKRALESYWAGRIDEAELETTARQLRLESYAEVEKRGLSTREAAIPESFSYYDQVLDVTALLGALPDRFAAFAGASTLERYFLLARGGRQAPALEMTKWFNTNYHYLVPEIGADTPIFFADDSLVSRFVEVQEAGYHVRPTLVGPLTYLLLAKGTDGFDPLDRLDEVLEVYLHLFERLAALGATWLQLDEPALASDFAVYSTQQITERLAYVYQRLGQAQSRPQLLVTTPYGDAPAALEVLAQTEVEAIHADLVRGAFPDRLDWGTKTLVAGVVDGRNVWRNDLATSLRVLEQVQETCSQVAVATATSLVHVPYDLSVEKWEDQTLDEDLHLWLAFANQKIEEVVALAQALENGPQSIATQLQVSRRALERRAEAEGVVRPEVRAQVAAVSSADRTRVPYPVRALAQEERFHLGALPTTTIGSFPQTETIRRARASYRAGKLGERAYREALEAEISSVVELQERIGLDVLVHGEAERNDMVQYFAELLDGFATTRHGWVQSYGSRCTRPSILWGDVRRLGPLTLEWISYAQSRTEKPMKGMLTGPVTILAWSFLREDIAASELADQVALAIREEVADLEAAGIGIIQVDEPALRELLPLRRTDQDDYLQWSVAAFRLATSGVNPETQIHTHLCYSEFGEVITAIDDLDADVTSLEAARSHMEVLPEIVAAGFARGLGPGVWDIHSPAVPSESQLVSLLNEAAAVIPLERLWANPDCGLKTRSYEEVVPALENLVAAAQQIRTTLHQY